MPKQMSDKLKFIGHLAKAGWWMGGCQLERASVLCETKHYVKMILLNGKEEKEDCRKLRVN